MTTSLCRKVAGLWNPADLSSNSALTQSSYTLGGVPPAPVSPRVLGVEAPASMAVVRKTNGVALSHLSLSLSISSSLVFDTFPANIKEKLVSFCFYEINK